MKVLFDHSSPFLLAHGGMQVQIEQTKAALERAGVDVEFLRWWDASQAGDLIHFFGRPAGSYIELAHRRKTRVVMAELLTGLGSRSPAAVAGQGVLVRAARRWIPSVFTAKMGWDAYASVDRIIALTPWEAQLMQRVFDAPAERIAVVPNGVVDEFFQDSERNVARESYLVCTATITERKRVLELAHGAVAAKIPVHFAGAPYSESDSYFLEFRNYSRQYKDFVKYVGVVNDRHRLADIYRRARGFVLLSTQESLSLSALEAAASGCPLLLSDLPWARMSFGDAAMYCPVAGVERTAQSLREFHDKAPDLKLPPSPMRWSEVAQQLKKIYEDLLVISR
jgi:glycosyltransferase involved in cell wall biosynthesis